MILLPKTVTTELYIVWICLVGDSGIHLHLPLLLGGFASQGTMSVWEQKKWKNKKKSIWYPKKHADLSSKKQLTKERTNRTQVVVYQKVMNHAGSSILRKSVKTKFTHAQHVTPKNHPPTPPPLTSLPMKLEATMIRDAGGFGRGYGIQLSAKANKGKSFSP